MFVNPIVFEHLTGHHRGLGVANNAAISDIIFADYFKRFLDGKVGGVWSELPTILETIKPEPIIGGDAFLGNPGDATYKFGAGPDDTRVHAAASYSHELTKTLGEPSYVVLKHSAKRALPNVSQVPLRLLIFDDVVAGPYTVYGHSYISNGGDRRLYIGMTRHGWALRWKQHLSSAKSGSPYLFHEAIRRDDGSRYEHHEVFAAGLTFSAAMKLEEKLVDKMSLHPRGLNMIPGGFEGLRYLGRHGFHNVKRKALEDRAAVLKEFSRSCANKGRPNPLVSAVWRDDNHAASVICNNPKNFDRSTVDEIRFLNSLGRDVSDIAKTYGVADRRIASLLGGSTYSRVR